MTELEAEEVLLRLAPNWLKSLHDPGKVSEVIEQIYHASPGRRKWPKKQPTGFRVFCPQVVENKRDKNLTTTNLHATIANGQRAQSHVIFSATRNRRKTPSQIPSLLAQVASSSSSS